MDPPLTSLSFVAPSFSITPINTIVSDFTLLTSLLPLAQCKGLEMGDHSRGDASIIEDDLLASSKKLTLVEPYVKEDPLEELDGDDMMVHFTLRI